MIKQSRGFTLVELMVTVVVIGILAMVAVPQFQSMRDRARVRAASEGVFAHLQFSRSESIKQGQNLTTRILTGTNWCLGLDNSNATTCDCNSNGVDACQFGPTGNITNHDLRSSDFIGITLSTTRNNVEFESRRGTITGVGNTITLTGSGGIEARIIYTSTGRIRLCGNMGGYPSC